MYEITLVKYAVLMLLMVLNKSSTFCTLVLENTPIDFMDAELAISILGLFASMLVHLSVG